MKRYHVRTSASSILEWSHAETLADFTFPWENREAPKTEFRALWDETPLHFRFDYLDEHIEQNVRERGEFQLTSALDRLRQEDGFLGLIMDGRRYDIGLPQYYLETLAAFSKE